MKIAVFENEYDSVKGAFDAANLIGFNNKIELINYPSSQSADFGIINEYRIIFIDIDLSAKSDLDGFGLLQKIKNLDAGLIKRIVILTGNNKIEESLKERGIYSNQIKILIKPVDYTEIITIINKVK